MKTLVLIRHANSNWGADDLNRSLSDLGKEESSKMARILALQQVEPDLFICSPAQRARETAAYFLKTNQHDETSFTIEPRLYEAPSYRYYEIIKSIPDEKDTVVLIGHNPGITHFINQLTEQRIPNMPTAAIFSVKMNSSVWGKFEEAPKTFNFFFKP